MIGLHGARRHVHRVQQTALLLLLRTFVVLLVGSEATAESLVLQTRSGLGETHSVDTVAAALAVRTETSAMAVARPNEYPMKLYKDETRRRHPDLSDGVAVAEITINKFATKTAEAVGPTKHGLDGAVETGAERKDAGGLGDGWLKNFDASNLLFTNGSSSYRTDERWRMQLHSEKLRKAARIGRIEPNNAVSRHKRLISERKNIYPECGSIVVGSGTIRSPNFPGNYYNNLNCWWKLEAAPAGSEILLRILRFSTEACCDFVRISNTSGVQISLYGELLPRDIIIESSATISFKTDFSVTDSGFEIEFETIRRLSDTDCGGTVVGSGTIRSPNFPGIYPNNLNCSWKLAAAPTGDEILLRILRVSTEGCCDFVTISNASGVQITLFGKLPPRDVVLGSSATISFTSDFSVTGGGFEIEFSTVHRFPGSQCGGLFHDSGVIRSPGFPVSYPSNINCTWTLQAALEHEAIFLQLRRFVTEECCDNLIISDDTGLLLSFSGTRLPQNITLGSRATISFTSDSFETRSGFDLAFNSMRRRDRSMGICGVGWTMNNGLCYRTVSPSSWSEAQQACSSLSGFLTDIGSRSEENTIYDLLDTQGIDRAWIGLNDRQRESQWLWNSGEAVTYVNWGYTEPNDKNGGEDCVEILARSRGGWNDNICNKQFHGVCRKTVPTPAKTMLIGPQAAVTSTPHSRNVSSATGVRGTTTAAAGHDTSLISDAKRSASLCYGRAAVAIGLMPYFILAAHIAACSA